MVVVAQVVAFHVQYMDNNNFPEEVFLPEGGTKEVREVPEWVKMHPTRATELPEPSRTTRNYQKLFIQIAMCLQTKCKNIDINHITADSRNFASDFWDLFWSRRSHVLNIICTAGGY